MIVDMVKVRILGPRGRLGAVLEEVQQVGTLHLTESQKLPGLRPAVERSELDRKLRRLREALEDAGWALARLDAAVPARAPAGRGGVEDESSWRDGEAAPEWRRNALAGWIRLARRARRQLRELEAERDRLAVERASLGRYRRFYRAFQDLLEREETWSGAEVYHLVLEAGEAGALERLERELGRALGDGFEILSRPLETGEIAAAVLLPGSTAELVESMLKAAGVGELSIPEEYGDGTLAEAMPAMEARLAEIERKLEETAARTRRLAEETRGSLLRARAGIGDRLAELEALGRAARTERAFVLEGWVPASEEPAFREALAERFGDEVVVTRLATEPWEAEEAPVVLTNPRLFRPFEAITRMLPLPTYGSIDPTPFVAVFFPMFFGLILGDVGYGAVLAALGLALHRRSRPGSILRSIAEIAGACAAFTVIFGFLYGELFGDLGRRLLGLEPLAFDREEALLPFLGLAVAIGVVHVVLGLALGAWGALRGGGKESLGKGVAAGMVLLTALALLAAVDVLPGAFFTPAIVALLVAFPVLVVLEGLLAPLELLSTLGNVLSYARIMALGTASVMMAVVANRMAGAVGSVLVGALFGLLFHLVNFALGVFGPTIHGLRLHYVEFFGKFYSPGGARYRPFGHWRHDGGEPPT